MNKLKLERKLQIYRYISMYKQYKLMLIDMMMHMIIFNIYNINMFGLNGL